MVSVSLGEGLISSFSQSGGFPKIAAAVGAKFPLNLRVL